MKIRKRKNNKKFLGPVTALIIISFVIMISSTIFSKIGFQAEKTTVVNNALQTSLVTVKNIISVDGIKYLFGNSILNFRLFEPLVLLIISLIAFGIADASGLLQIVIKPLKNVKPSFVTLLLVLLGFISSIIGEYSFVILLPFAGLLYKYLGKNSVLGVITVFLGITFGYASGVIFNYDNYLLGTLTKTAAIIDVDPTYQYNNFSTLYIMIGSMIIMVPIVAKLIDINIAPKFKKPLVEESEKATSKKGLVFSNIALLIMMIMVAYMIVPGIFGSGILLDKSQPTYIAKLFADGAPFKEGIMLIFLIIMIVCSFIYGKISKNIETSKGFTESLSKCLEHCGYLLALMFFASQMNSILEWTGLGEVLVCKIVEMLSLFKISGILLIVVFFILVMIMTLIMPSTLGKWLVVSPLMVPLFMRANITPELTQFIFQVADGIGKTITPIFPFFIVMIGFLYHNNADEDYSISIFRIIKLILSTVLIITIFWILLIIIWYLAGFPLGISGYTVL